MDDGATVWQGDQARRAVRAALEAAGLTMKQASRALGRNDAYLQQYLYRGTPRRLPEPLRLHLAEITGADQADFLDPALRALRPPAGGGEDGAVWVPLHAVRAAAGGGSVPDEASGCRDSLAFPPALLRRITAAPAGGIPPRDSAGFRPLAEVGNPRNPRGIPRCVLL